MGMARNNLLRKTFLDFSSQQHDSISWLKNKVIETIWNILLQIFKNFLLTACLMMPSAENWLKLQP